LVHIPNWLSLLIIGSTLLVTIMVSMFATKNQAARKSR